MESAWRKGKRIEVEKDRWYREGLCKPGFMAWIPPFTGKEICDACEIIGACLNPAGRQFHRDSGNAGVERGDDVHGRVSDRDGNGELHGVLDAELQHDRSDGHRDTGDGDE